MDQLKSAERSASALVENARKERIDRMKEARTEVGKYMVILLIVFHVLKCYFIENMYVSIILHCMDDDDVDSFFLSFFLFFNTGRSYYSFL